MTANVVGSYIVALENVERVSREVPSETDSLSLNRLRELYAGLNSSLKTVYDGAGIFLKYIGPEEVQSYSQRIARQTRIATMRLDRLRNAIFDKQVSENEKV